MPGYKTHGTIGAAAGLTVGAATGEPVLAAAGTVLGALGGLLPDGDHPDAWISGHVPGLHRVVSVLPGGHRGATHWPILAAALWLGGRALCQWRGCPVALADAAGWGYALHLAADALTVEGIPGIVRPTRRLHLLPRRLRPASGGAGEWGIRVVAALGFVAVWAVMLGLAQPAGLGSASFPPLPPDRHATEGPSHQSFPPASAEARPAPAAPTGASWTDGPVQAYRRADRWMTWVAYNWAWIARHHLDLAPPTGTGGAGGAGIANPLGGAAIWIDPTRWPIPAHEEGRGPVARTVGRLAWDRKPYAAILGLRANNSPLSRTADDFLLGEDAGVGLALVALVTAVVWRGRRNTALGRLRRRKQIVIETEEMDLPGSARWATPDELAVYEGEQAVPVVFGVACDPLGRLIGRGKKVLALPWDLAAQNVLVVAPPGAGKSVRLITATLRLIARRATKAGKRLALSSLFMWDPSGELWQKAGGALRLAGYDVIAVHPYRMRGRVNPVLWCEDGSWCDVLLDAWCANTGAAVGGGHDKFYTDIFKTVMRAGILAGRALWGTEATLPRIADEFNERAGEDDEDYTARVEAFLGRAGDGGNGVGMWRRMWANPGTRSNGRTSIKQRLQPLQNPKVRHMLSGSDVDLDRLLGNVGTPPAIFFQLPSARQDSVAPITAAVLALIFAQIGERSEGRALTRQLVCLLDEAGSGAVIHGLAAAVATLRKAGVCIVTYWQSLGQVVSRYPEHAREIFDGHGTWVGLRGMGTEDARAFAERLGERAVQVTDWHVHPVPITEIDAARALGAALPEPRRVPHRRTERRPLLTPVEIPKIAEWVAIVSPRDRYPFLAFNKPYFQDTLRDLAGIALPDREEPSVAAPAGEPAVRRTRAPANGPPLTGDGDDTERQDAAATTTGDGKEVMTAATTAAAGDDEYW